MDDHTCGPRRDHEEARYWRIRAALDVVRFAAWAAAAALHALAASGWTPHL